MKLKMFIAFALILVCAQSAFAGDVTGTIKYEGKIPKLKAIKMDADPACAAKHSTPPVSEALVLGEGNTMGNVFVRVKSGLPAKEYPTPTEPAVITQEGCVYSPHVIGVMKGQPIKFINSDGVLHNVNAQPKVNRKFNIGMPATVTEAEKSFQKVEDFFPVKCDVHPWMSSHVAVMEHPFFDVTGKDGSFKIEGLEPGTYEIEAWHEKLGAKTATVTIGADGTTSDFTFSRPSKG